MNEDRVEELPVEYEAEVKHVRASADRLQLAQQNLADELKGEGEGEGDGGAEE